MLVIVRREKKKSRSGALRVLDHAMTGPEGADNCIKFIDVLGLRSLFPLFMKTPKKTKRAGALPSAACCTYTVFIA
jgi:beta-catenin-like protein 1